MRGGRALSGAVMGLLNSRILKSRLGSVGMFSNIKVLNYGITGIIARSSGVRKDLRLGRDTHYGAY
jgi:NADH:ubiquinone oxidoreductase subunit D